MNTFIKSALVGLIAVGAATSAAADKHSHTVYVYKRGYFPTTIYTASGDWVQYVNKSSDWRFMEIPYYQYAWKNDPETSDFWIPNNGIQYVQMLTSSGDNFEFDAVDYSSNDPEHNGFIVHGSAPSQ
jgi:hypothetical protein